MRKATAVDHREVYSANWTKLNKISQTTPVDVNVSFIIKTENKIREVIIIPVWLHLLLFDLDFPVAETPFCFRLRVCRPSFFIVNGRAVCINTKQPRELATGPHISVRQAHFSTLNVVQLCTNMYIELVAPFADSYL